MSIEEENRLKAIISYLISDVLEIEDRIFIIEEHITPEDIKFLREFTQTK